MKMVFDIVEAKRLSLQTKEPVVLIREEHAYAYKNGKITLSGEIPKNLFFLLKKATS